MIDKLLLRRRFLKLRAEFPAESRLEAERIIISRLEALIPPRTSVAGYATMRGEADIFPLLERLHRQGSMICLPCMTEDAPLLFRAWMPESALAANAFRVKEPDAACAPMTPEILLIPLLAFNRQGFRIGYGGGHYDRTLAALRARPGFGRAIGVAFSFQEAEFAPEPHDAPLDAVVTEAEILRFQTGSETCSTS